MFVWLRHIDTVSVTDDRDVARKVIMSSNSINNVVECQTFFFSTVIWISFSFFSFISIRSFKIYKWNNAIITPSALTIRTDDWTNLTIGVSTRKKKRILKTKYIYIYFVIHRPFISQRLDRKKNSIFVLKPTGNNVDIVRSYLILHSIIKQRIFPNNYFYRVIITTCVCTPTIQKKKKINKYSNLFLA